MMVDSYLSSASKLHKALLSNTVLARENDAAKSPLKGYEGTCLTRYSGMSIQNRSQWRRLSLEQVPMTSDSRTAFWRRGVGKGHFWREPTFCGLIARHCTFRPDLYC